MCVGLKLLPEESACGNEWRNTGFGLIVRILRFEMCLLFSMNFRGCGLLVLPRGAGWNSSACSDDI